MPLVSLSYYLYANIICRKLVLFFKAWVSLCPSKILEVIKFCKLGGYTLEQAHIFHKELYLC